jgi:hypothetical protein
MRFLIIPAALALALVLGSAVTGETSKSSSKSSKSSSKNTKHDAKGAKKDPKGKTTKDPKHHGKTTITEVPVVGTGGRPGPVGHTPVGNTATSGTTTSRRVHTLHGTLTGVQPGQISVSVTNSKGTTTHVFLTSPQTRVLGINGRPVVGVLSLGTPVTVHYSAAGTGNLASSVRARKAP